jgi:predicted dehydrogenase
MKKYAGQTPAPRSYARRWPCDFFRPAAASNRRRVIGGGIVPAGIWSRRAIRGILVESRIRHELVSTPEDRRMNRRDFLKGSAAAASLAMLSGAFGPHVAYAQDRKPYRVGLIGSGWYGRSDLFRLIQVAPVEVVSICDVDKNMREGAADITAQRHASKKRPRLYGDYREMLKEKDLDLCVIGSPDHWHALHLIAAVEAGCDVYVQKPISTDVREGEAMIAAARRHNKVVQVGTQRKSTPHLIDVRKQVIEAGLLGRIGHVEVCCYVPMRANGAPEVQPVPDFLDYDLWTGPAPLRPYDGIPHRRWWRTMFEYGNGITGDMCIHMLDTVRWMLGLGWPTRVTSAGGIRVQGDVEVAGPDGAKRRVPGKSNISDTQIATFEYPDFDVCWTHRTWGSPPDPDYPWAMFIYGDKGTLKASTMRADFIPQGKDARPMHFDCVFEKEQYPEDTTEKDIELNAAPATRLHMKDWLAAVERRTRPVADIAEAHASTASCILANLSMQLGGRPIDIDPATGKVKGDDLQPLLARPYREGWQHPGGPGEWKPWTWDGRKA